MRLAVTISIAQNNKDESPNYIEPYVLSMKILYMNEEFRNTGYGEEKSVTTPFLEVISSAHPAIAYGRGNKVLFLRGHNKEGDNIVSTISSNDILELYSIKRLMINSLTYWSKNYPWSTIEVDSKDYYLTSHTEGVLIF
jgi:hypothetical protein